MVALNKELCNQQVVGLHGNEAKDLPDDIKVHGGSSEYANLASDLENAYKTSHLLLFWSLAESGNYC